MNQKQRNLVKIALFCGFITFFIFVGSTWKLHPPVPTRVNDKPYSASVHQMHVYADQLEGQPVITTDVAHDVTINASTGDLSFTITDDFYSLSVQVVFPGWAPGGNQPPGTVVVNGSLVVIKGTCKQSSAGMLEADEFTILNPDIVYQVSISGLVVIGAMLFYHYRFDFKSFRFARRSLKKTTTPEKVA
jgi:hypothetical protein